MMIALLAQSELLNPRMRSIRDHFAAGGRWGDMAMVLLGMGACVLLLVLYNRLRDPSGRRERDNPRRLFQYLLKGLGLSAAQRRAMLRMADDLRLEHPAALLLSRDLFDEHTGKWRQAHPGMSQDDLDRIAHAVFATAALPSDND